MITQQSASGSDHALVELVLYVVRFAAGDLEAAQSFLDVVQQVLDVRQLAVEVRRTLELDELRHHLCVVFLPHTAKHRHADHHRNEHNRHRFKAQ